MNKRSLIVSLFLAVAALGIGVGVHGTDAQAADAESTVAAADQGAAAFGCGPGEVCCGLFHAGHCSLCMPNRCP